MSAVLARIESLDTGGFVDRVGVELNRAERYRIFVSLTLIDLSPLAKAGNGLADGVRESLGRRVRETVRACDYVAFVDNTSLAMLFPETPRQGAEIASRRVAALVREEIAKVSGETKDVIPVEIASYPDTAGAKTMNAFLEELAKKRRN